MNSSRYILMTSVVLTMGLTGLPASAAGLLGGVLGGGTSGGTAGSVVTLQSGPAANNGLVNVGLGGGDGNIADVRLGGDGLLGSDSSTLADVNISSGGNNGLLDADATVGGIADANVNIGGNGDLLRVDVGVGGLDGIGGTGGDGGAGGTGGGFNGFFGAAGGAGMGINCIGPDGRKVLNFPATHGYSQRSFAAWGSATNIKLVAIKLCPAARQALARSLLNNGSIQGLQTAVASDMLINGSLNRARSNASHVLAVTQSGRGVTVYVY